MQNGPEKHPSPTVGIKRQRKYHEWYRRRIWAGPGGLRLRQLERQPLCSHCLAEERITPATDVDHVIAHRGIWSVFCDGGNLQSLCKSCHSLKTARGE